jgi:hypothetical protein
LTFNFNIQLQFIHTFLDPKVKILNKFLFTSAFALQI